MKIVIPLMALLLFVGMSFTAQSKNQAKKESNFPSQIISDFFRPAAKAPDFNVQDNFPLYRKHPNDAESSISEQRHIKKSSDHIIYYLSNKDQIIWSYDPITVTDNSVKIYEKSNFLEDPVPFLEAICRYTLFYGLGILLITALFCAFAVPIMALREIFEFINSRIRISRS